MLRLFWVLGRSCFLLLLVSLAANSALAQLETATVSGQVVDPSGLSITGALVKLVDIDRDTTTGTATNTSGLYTFPSVRPGRYRMQVTAAGFSVVNVTGLIVNVQDHIEQNFRLQVGSVAESVTVTAGAPLVNTTDASVSTVVDRNFAENLPLNGRSFQTLIQLTPGVTLTNADTEGGQFSVNGQRANANYWTVDGVSANFGVSAGIDPGSGLGGAAPSFSVGGGTNSLVSVDAMQEFRIQTSTYAPEFGRTPGGQISILTRSGTNQFHGSAFDYFRNDALDANDWFADQNGLPKPEERQNDFGGTFGGPIIKDKTFFFFSYEGLRLRLPQVAATTVPSVSARQAAIPAMQPFFNAYPIPNGQDFGDGTAEYNASYSNRSSLDATSLRIDHKVNDRLALFGRYSYSPSNSDQRPFGYSPSMVGTSQVTTQTATVGATLSITPLVADELRLNYSRSSASGYYTLDNLGGAVPVPSSSLPLPSPFSLQNAYFEIGIFPVTASEFIDGEQADNLQRQFNLVDNLSMQRGAHSLKFGVDYRRLTPIYRPPAYEQFAGFFTMSDAEQGQVDYGFLTSAIRVPSIFQNLGLFAQDTWRATTRLTLTYGLRWDVDFAPATSSGPNITGVINFNDLSSLALAPSGAPPFTTKHGNVAPRIGAAFRVSQDQRWESVLRGGFGVFYDLATQEAGNMLLQGYPFNATNVVSGVQYPYNASTGAPPPIAVSELSSGGVLVAFNPELRLPYTLEWNVAFDQSLGNMQSLSASYVGSLGRRLIATEFASQPNPNISYAYLVGNFGYSNYNALQLQFRRRMSHGLQALASYTWAHSIDTGSASSFGSFSNAYVGALSANSNRGDSDFDIRNAMSLGATYDIPGPRTGAFEAALLGGWSFQNVFQASSAPPVTIISGINLDGGQIAVRPNVVPGVPVYLYGSQYPGGKAINSAAFAPPPTNEQGDLGRNALRGFGAWQWDLAVHRDFPIHEALKLQFRAEMFNVLNHPNFGSPNNFLGTALFGQATQMLGQSLGGQIVGSGGLNPLYQIGGPRSIQLALKLQF